MTERWTSLSTDARGRSTIVVAAAVGVLALWLRLRDLSSMEFGYDEGIVMKIAQRVLDGDFVTTSNYSSVGALNPPLFPYLIALPGAIGDGPLAATAFVGVCAAIACALTVLVAAPRFGLFAATLAGALFAVSPWTVRFGRKLWSPDMLPILLVALLLCLFLVLERERSWAVAGLPVLLCACFQLHFSSVALAVPIIAVLAFRARTLHLGALAVGIVAAALLIAPYFGHELRNDFRDIQRLAAEGGDGPTAWNWAGVSRGIDRTSQLVSAEDWRYMLGTDERAFAADKRPLRVAGRAAGLVSLAALLLGMVVLAVRTVRRARPTRRWPFVDLDLDSAREALLLVWIVGIWLSFASSAPARVYPHYLIITWPISLLVVGIFFRDVRNLVLTRRWLRVAPIAVAGATVAGLAGFTVASQSFVSQNGGGAGDYGVAYEHVAGLARLAADQGLPIDDLALEAARDLFPHRDAPDAPHASVANVLYGQTLGACDGSIATFGPLSACFPSASSS